MKNDTLIVSCTNQGDKEKTLLYQSIKSLDYNYTFCCNNTTGLSKMYNRFLTKVYADKYKYIVYVHDDVWIDDALISSKLNEAMHGESKFDIVGLAGTLDPQIRHPALWHVMGKRENHRGYAGHIFGEHKVMTSFGQTPDRVAVVDGLFVAVNVARALETGWKWNENFDFHHYDIASCIDANAKDMRVGVWPINVFHASPGLKSLEDVAWSASNTKFLQLYF
jgi:hypothetical protein